MTAIIEVDHVTKEFTLGTARSLKRSLLDGARRLAGKPVEHRAPFKALDDVNFSIQPGEVVGIIGHNGAGKSTLLKLLANIAAPTHGRVAVRGRVAPLIEVGAGLVPDLTGRENVYLNATILGMKKAEIARKFDEIVAFAELEEFIDTPVKRYSSGMQVRLGFSIATSIDADVLIVDEVLAVGDLAFQRKCITRMENLIKNDGKTVLLVNHNVRQLERLCSRVMLMDHGRIIFDGGASEGCSRFYEANNAKILQDSKRASTSRARVESSGELEVLAVHVHAGDGRAVTEDVEMHESMHIAVRYRANVDLTDVEIVVGIHTTDFVYVASAGTAVLDEKPSITSGEHELECSLPDVALYPGVYAVRLAFLDQYSRPIWYGESLTSFRVTCHRTNRAKMPNLGLVDLPFEWNLSGASVHHDRRDSRVELLER